MPNYSDQLVRITPPMIATLAPSQDTTSDQLAAFYRPSSIPFIRHSPLPVASLAPNNAATNTTTKEIIVQGSSGGGTVFSGVSSLNSLTGALAVNSPNSTILVGTAGPDVTVDVKAPLPVAYGGSGSVSPSLIAGTSINITGSWPNQTIVNTGTGQVPINSATYKALSGSVAITANILTAIDSIAVTFPGSGGPWRVFVQYVYYKSGGVNYHSYISDGTNGWGGVDMVTQNNITNLFNGGFSPVTYANGATKTFTVNIYDTGNSTIVTTSRILGSSPAVSNMQVTVLSSN